MKFRSFTMYFVWKVTNTETDNNPSILLREDNNRSHLISQSSGDTRLGYGADEFGSVFQLGAELRICGSAFWFSYEKIIRYLWQSKLPFKSVIKVVLKGLRLYQSIEMGVKFAVGSFEIEFWAGTTKSQLAKNTPPPTRLRSSCPEHVGLRWNSQVN